MKNKKYAKLHRKRLQDDHPGNPSFDIVSCPECGGAVLFREPDDGYERTRVFTSSRRVGSGITGHSGKPTSKRRQGRRCFGEFEKTHTTTDKGKRVKDARPTGHNVYAEYEPV